MWFFRCEPETGKLPVIVCTSCGNRAAEAGFAVHDTDIEKDWSSLSMTIYEEVMRPLCEECVTT